MVGKGRFVWHDLMATDVNGAKRFYGELFGWTFKADEHDYLHITAGGHEIGGLMKLDPKIASSPHWLGYVSVDNVDATVVAVTKNGGKTCMPKKDIPTVGQFAVCADPQGAIFAPFHYTGKDAGKPESNAPPAPYTFCWDELMTSDAEAAVRFYSTMFGWRADSMDMPGFGRYTLLKRPGIKDDMGSDKNAAGLMKLPSGVPHPLWLTYVAVQSADAIAEKAKKLGGTVTSPPMDIPKVGRFAALLDAQQAPVAVLAAAPR